MNDIINFNDRINEISMDNIVFHGSKCSDSDFLEINWQLLYGCNYKCSYCFGQETLNKKDFISIDKLKHAVDNIFKINKKYYTFSLLGGEPTYHPYFLELVKYIYSFDKNISLLLISNGSKNTDYFEKLLYYAGNNDLYFHFSIHFEYADIEHIKDLIKLFNKYKKIISINLMLHPEYKDKIHKYFNELIEFQKEYYFNLGLAELREPPDFNTIDSRYDKDFFNWIDNSRNTIEYSKHEIDDFTNRNILFPQVYFKVKNINNNIEDICIHHNIALRNNLQNFKKFYCCGGINLIVINNDGSYRGGQCPQFPTVGNIYEDDEINLFKLSNFIRCNMYQCGCETNARNNKYIDIEKAKKYVLNYKKKDSNYMINYMQDIYNKVNEIDNKINNIIDTLAWWIPIKKYRDNFRNKFK